MTDQNITLYYGVTATDKAGNVNQPAVTGASTTNLAKGVPTISNSAPTNFAADGDLSRVVRNHSDPSLGQSVHPDRHPAPTPRSTATPT